MAITRAQQFRQMLEDGGMLVQPSMTGKRPGYRGPGEYQSGKSDKKESGMSPGRSQAQFGHAGHAGKTEDQAKSDQRLGNDRPDAGPGSNPFAGHTKAEKKGFQKQQEINKQIQEGTFKPSKPSVIDKFNKFQATKFTPLRKNTLRNLIDYIAGGRKFMGLPGAIGSIYTDFTGKGLNMNVEDYEGLENVSPAQLQAMFGQDIIGTADEEKIRDISKVLGQDVVSQSDFEQFYPNMNVPDDRGGPDQQEGDPCKGPNPPAYCFANQNPTPTPPTTPTTSGLALRFRKDGGRINAMDGGMMSPEGGIMDLETGRQMYFLGKLVKKATRAVKKVAKSPLGKAALGIAALKFGPAFLKSEGLKNFFLTDPSKGFSLSNLFGKGLTTKGTMAGIAALSAAPLLFGQEEEDEEEFDRGPGLDIRKIRENPYDFLGPNFANGGRIGYQEGSKEPVAKKTMPLLDMGGKEMDLREDGGFVPIGRMEKADDVPARLSKNEFVFTAEAVRNAGEGDVDKGAEVMYNMMKNLESGGEVSEESQGLEGARRMFQTSKRLEEVL